MSVQDFPDETHLPEKGGLPLRDLPSVNNYFYNCMFVLIYLIYKFIKLIGYVFNFNVIIQKISQSLRNLLIYKSIIPNSYNETFVSHRINTLSYCTFSLS